MIYREKEGKLKLRMGGGDDPVRIEVTCYHGSVAVVSFSNEGPRTARCGDTQPVGRESGLKGKRRRYTSGGNNPMGNGFKVKHVFTSSVDQITYTFPDDYTGEVPHDPDDMNPSCQFIVNYD